MDFKALIEDDTILITDDDIKRKILSFLSEEKDIYNIKFMNIDEVIKKLFFDYDKESIYYLMSNYNMSYSVAENYIKNMYFIEEETSDSDKINLLIKYKKELEEHNLFIKDPLFTEYIKNKKIKACMMKITKYQKHILDIISKYASVQIIEFKYNKYPHTVYEFNTLEEEVEYVAYRICELIEKGIDINKIKISNIDDDYISIVKRTFKNFNIPVNLKENSYIIGTKICKNFLSNLDSDINKTIESISIYKDDPIYNQIINICNKYAFIDDFLKVKDLIIHDFENTKVTSKKLKNAIEVVDYKSIFDDEYVFLMNFNLKSIPKVYKDEDYITDNIKPEFLDTTVEKNKLEKSLTIKSIDNIKNLVITYKKVTFKEECYPSNLVELYDVETPSINVYKSYSKLNDELKLSKDLDKLIKYGNKGKNLNALKYNYDIPYMNYDNKYKKIDIDTLYKLSNNKLNFSYTNIESYNECAFKYYLTNILKLNVFEENFAATLGTLFHHVLEIGIDKDIDVNSEVDSFIKDKEFTKSENFFIENIKENIKFTLDTIKHHMKLSNLNKVLTEKKVYISKDRNIKITFSGIIDKLLYKEESDKTILAIIDYKTSNSIDIDLKYMKYGIGLQLPVYIYLANNMEFKNIKFAGIYLQKVLPSKDKAKELEKKKKEDKLKLEGYSNSNQDIIKEFDFTYKDSEIIKGLSTKKDGDFKATSKVLTDNEFEKLGSLASLKIDETIENVLNANFDINPVKKEGESDVYACRYCEYKDICFRTNNDIKNLKKDNDLSFLGGENND